MPEGTVTRRTFLRYGVTALAAVPMAPLLAGCGNERTAGKNDAVGGSGSVTLRVSSSQPGGAALNAHTAMFNKLKELTEDKTKGRVKLQYFPDSQLGEEAQVAKQMSLGTVDMAIISPSVFSTTVPELGMLDLGYLFDDFDQVARALDGEAGKAVRDLFAAGTRSEILAFGYNFGFRNVNTIKPVSTPQDLRGVSLRVLPAPNFVATLKAMGATPVPLPSGEIYTALQTGVIEGLEHDPVSILQLKTYEKANQYALTKHIFNLLNPVISQVSLKKLSTGDQDALRSAAKEASESQREQAAAEEQKALKNLAGKGVKIHEVDRALFRERVKPLWGQFSTKYPKAKPALDAIIATQQGS
jgi:tripartite ATP-independent transporter DctP family solute receptor